MMFKEIFINPKCKVVIIVLIVVILFTVVFSVTQLKKGNNNFLSESLKSKEFSAVSGDWKITEYLGESVEFHGAEASTDTKSENDKAVKEIKEKYLDKELHLDSNHIQAFSPPTELGYHVLNWNDLFSIYRQPSDIWDGISPPFLCISFSLKDFHDSFGLIVDSNDIATLVVKGQFFRMEQSESKYPFIKITQIKNFYNNDYYGKILNYRIDSNVVDGEKRYIVDYNVEYPQLYKIKNKSVMKKVNNQLKMILFQEDEYNQILNNFSSIINKNQEGVEYAEGTCKIYLFNDEYISLGYKCDFGNGGPQITVDRLLTINLGTGDSVCLKDFVNTDIIIKNLKNLQFDIIEGSYTDGFGTGKEDERISSFIEAFQESNKYNSTEFSIDNTYLYLNFQYDDSLDGYMLLRFKLNDLKQ